MWLQFVPSGSKTRLQWGNDRGPYPYDYQIGTASLKKEVEGFRAPLNLLAQWGRTGSKEQLFEILRKTALAGERLRFVLFDARSDIRELTTWIEEEYIDGDRTLKVTANPDLHVPWGLVFQGDAKKTFDETEDLQKALSLFWSYKYDLSAVFASCNMPKQRVIRSKKNLKVISLVNREEYSYLIDQSESSHAYDRFIKMPLGAAFNIEACEGLVRRASSFDTIFHFFGHGGNGKLIVDAEESLDPTGFKMLVAELTDRAYNSASFPVSLFFLNACESLLQNTDYSLRSAAAKRGVCGIIATEAEVPRDFAIRYGASLLSMLIDEGRTIGEAMSAMRRDPSWLPFSLLYGCYAPLEYQIK